MIVIKNVDLSYRHRLLFESKNFFAKPESVPVFASSGKTFRKPQAHENTGLTNREREREKARPAPPPTPAYLRQETQYLQVAIALSAEPLSGISAQRE